MQESDGLDDSGGSTNGEVVLMSRKFKKMMKKEGNFQHSSRRKDSKFKKTNKEENNEIICFECRKPRHMKADCPQLKKKRYLQDKKRKSLMVTWDDLDSEKSNSSNNE